MKQGLQYNTTEACVKENTIWPYVLVSTAVGITIGAVIRPVVVYARNIFKKYVSNPMYDHETPNAFLPHPILSGNINSNHTDINSASDPYCSSQLVQGFSSYGGDANQVPSYPVVGDVVNFNTVVCIHPPQMTMCTHQV